jgi:integrase
MAIKTVSLRIRIKTSEGKRVMVKPVYTTKGCLKPLYALVNGVEELHPEGTYALRIGNSWEFVGQATDVALATKKRREDELADNANIPAPVSVINESGPEILVAMETYLAKKSITDKDTGKEALVPKTISGMRTIIESFRRTCGKKFMREVTGGDFVGYFSMLRTQANLDPKHPEYSEQLRKRNVTIKNHYATLRTFFKRSKIDITAMLEEEQVPRAKGRVPTAYSDADIQKMKAVANSEEWIRLQFFYASGFRKREVAYLRWEDLDLTQGLATVCAHDGFVPKDKESRTIDLPDYMVKALIERRERYLNTYYVFPSPTGLVADKNQFLYLLKDVAERAGIKGRVDIHKFRASYASALYQSGEVTVEEIASRLGHASVETTRLYLEKMNHNTARAKRQSNTALAAGM